MGNKKEKDIVELYDLIEKNHIYYAVVSGKESYDANEVEKDYTGNIHQSIFFPDSMLCGRDSFTGEEWFEDATVMISYPNDYELIKNTYDELCNCTNIHGTFIYLALQRMVENKEYYFNTYTEEE